MNRLRAPRALLEAERSAELAGARVVVAAAVVLISGPDPPPAPANRPGHPPLADPHRCRYLIVIELVAVVVIVLGLG